MAARRRHLQRRRRARGQGHQGRRVRRVRRDPRGRRGPRAHLRARRAPRREPARGRPAGRRGEGQDPRDRLRAPPPVAVDQARRGPGAAAARRRWRSGGDAATAAPATSTTCPSWACPRTSSPTAPAAEAEPEAAGEAERRRDRGRRAEPRLEPPRPRREPSRGRGAGRAEDAGRRGDAAPSTRPRRASHWRSPPFVGLTGGIGAGKSEALAALERLGAATLSTDAVVHELYASPEVRDAVVERWGARWRPAASPTAPRSRKRAFATPEEREWLEGLLWPRVGRAHRGVARGAVARDAAAAGARRRGAAAVRVGDGRSASTLPSRWWPTRPSGASGPAASGHAALDERTARQLTQEEKAARATYTVANAGTLEELEQTLSGVLEKLKPGT